MPLLAEPSLHTLKYHVIPPVPHTEVWGSHSSWQTPASLFSAVAEIGWLNANEVWRKAQQTREFHGLRPMSATCVRVFSKVSQFASVNWSNASLPSSQDYSLKKIIISVYGEEPIIRYCATNMH